MIESLTNNKRIKRLEYLSKMLGKYAHRWNPRNGTEPSQRMYDWVDEYNAIKQNHYDDFVTYCEMYNYTTQHDGYDNLA